MGKKGEHGFNGATGEYGIGVVGQQGKGTDYIKDKLKDAAEDLVTVIIKDGVKKIIKSGSSGGCCCCAGGCSGGSTSALPNSTDIVL